MTEITHGTVTGRFTEELPGLGATVPAAGTATLTAEVRRLVDLSPETLAFILPAPIHCILDADGDLVDAKEPGVKGVRAMATDNPRYDPLDWTWRLDIVVTDRAGTRVILQESYPIEVAGGTATDLATFAPLPSSEGTAVVRGPQGERGEVGPTGAQGNQGATGNDSTVPGPRGERGTDGWGINVRGTIATSADLPASAQLGDAFRAADTGILHVFALDGWAELGIIVGPEGPAGPQGERGPQGVPGPQGEQGIPGTAAFKGDKGDPGPQGIQGESGAPGADSTVPGPAGPQGEPGPKGDTGAAGSAGADSLVPGPAGTQGEPGPKGDTGATGAASTVPGPAGPQGIPGVKGDTGAAGPAGPVETGVVRVVNHGADANVARPAFASVRWIGSVAPLNAAVYDDWLNTTAGA